jgi:Brp/Blh family beta-carotene 15,15'-monooxygenase
MIKNKDVEIFTIVATFFSLWLATYFDETIENILAYFLIFTFGILHGANDIKLLQITNKEISTKQGFRTTSLYYLLFVIGIGLLFLFIPIIALASFVLFSGYHFGEQHWVSKIKIPSALNFIFLSAYGVSILFLIFSYILLS